MKEPAARWTANQPPRPPRSFRRPPVARRRTKRHRAREAVAVPPAIWAHRVESGATRIRRRRTGPVVRPSRSDDAKRKNTTRDYNPRRRYSQHRRDGSPGPLVTRCIVRVFAFEIGFEIEGTGGRPVLREHRSRTRAVSPCTACRGADLERRRPEGRQRRSGRTHAFRGAAFTLERAQGAPCTKAVRATDSLRLARSSITGCRIVEQGLPPGSSNGELEGAGVRLPFRAGRAWTTCEWKGEEARGHGDRGTRAPGTTPAPRAGP